MTNNNKIEDVNVLVVDDEVLIGETIKDLLEMENFKVTLAQNAAQAIIKIKEISPDLILTDLKLPDRSGLEILKEAKKNDPDVCVIVMTAYANVETAIKALEEEVYDYITKPFDPERVKLIIKKGLERRRLTLRNKELLQYLQKEKNKLESILEIGEKMSSILNLEELVDFIVVKATEVIESQRGSLMLMDKEGGVLKIVASKGLKDKIIKNTQVKIGERIVGWVAKTGEPLLVLDVDKQTDRHRTEDEIGAETYKSKSFLSMPLKKEKEIIGVINLTDKNNPKDNTFTMDDLRLLSIIVNQAVVSIENAKLYKEIKVLSITDSLTGLFNRRYFEERLKMEISRAERYKRFLCLIMLDIDNFKEYNDTYGHLKGDVVLQKVARILKKNSRKVDIISRYGGEEFVIVLPETNMAEAKEVAEKIRRAVKEFFLEGVFFKEISISGGISSFHHKLSMDDLIKRADDSLYRAKREGKNQICVDDILSP
ncbi:diguanylate cyclase [bacterium]|nr:diguanylate cyclase [bacterium]